VDEIWCTDTGFRVNFVRINTKIRHASSLHTRLTHSISQFKLTVSCKCVALLRTLIVISDIHGGVFYAADVNKVALFIIFDNFSMKSESFTKYFSVNV
jgi:hypothetical protein